MSAFDRVLECFTELAFGFEDWIFSAQVESEVQLQGRSAGECSDRHSDGGEEGAAYGTIPGPYF